MTIYHMFADSLTILLALYVCGACVCRLRHRSSDVRVEWRLLNVGMFALSAWLVADVLSHRMGLWALCVVLIAALYVRMTAGAWSDGVPPIARPDASRGGL